jgi:hypothetical protein
LFTAAATATAIMLQQLTYCCSQLPQQQLLYFADHSCHNSNWLNVAATDILEHQLTYFFLSTDAAAATGILKLTFVHRCSSSYWHIEASSNIFLSTDAVAVTGI